MVPFGFLTSCDNDEDGLPNNGQVMLLSFGPTGAKHGEEIRFIGYNLDKVESIELPGATVAKASFIEQTSELIRLTVPEEATEGYVTLKVNGGDDVVSKTQLSFDVPITVASVTSTVKPGNELTITGTKLNWVEGVVFDQDTVRQFVSQTPTQVVLQTPVTAKTGKLIIMGGGTEPSFIETEEDVVFTLPAVASLSPNTLNNGEDLTIVGTDLDLVKEVVFTGVGEAKVSSFVTKSATELVAKVPANATKGTLTLVAISGVEVTTTQELTLVLPAVTSLTPGAIKHGENLTITGTNLDLIKEINFTGVGTAKVVKDNFVSQSATSLVVTVPNNASKGTLKLVANSGAEVTTIQELTIVLPVITTLSPAPVNPGQDLTINGTNLDLVESIEFQGGTVVSTFESKTQTRIVVKVPMNAKKGVLKLTTTSNYAITTDAQVIIILPAITSVTPEPVVVGNYLTINGTDLNLVRSVIFTGDVTVSTFTAQNENQIVLMVPATAKTGVLKLITTSNFEVTTDKRAQIGSAAPNISYYIYNDALRSEDGDEWQQWGGWGTSTQDLVNTEQVNRGSKAIKVVYSDAYGALQLHPNNANALAGYTHILFYIRGTVDSQMGIQVKNSAGTASSDFAFDVKKDEYKLIEVPISSLGDVSGGISELYIKNYDTAPNTVYIDDLGLR